MKLQVGDIVHIKEENLDGRIVDIVFEDAMYMVWVDRYDDYFYRHELTFISRPPQQEKS